MAYGSMGEHVVVIYYTHIIFLYRNINIFGHISNAHKKKSLFFSQINKIPPRGEGERGGR